MDIAFEQKIRQRAYEIWIAAGMVDGAAEEHWLLAKDDVLNEAQIPVVAKAAPRAAKTKTADKVAKTAPDASPKASPKTAAKPAAAKPIAAKPKAAKPARKAVAPENRAAV